MPVRDDAGARCGDVCPGIRVDPAAAEATQESHAEEANVTSSERHVNDEFLAAIDDPEIRAAFKKLLKSFARRKSKA